MLKRGGGKKKRRLEKGKKIRYKRKHAPVCLTSAQADDECERTGAPTIARHPETYNTVGILKKFF
jgi:hypothetical protein